jgi:outer membrane protein OmpA-like peptidoglycan-associated protein
MKTVLLLAFILPIQISLFAQEKSPTELKELFYDAEFFFAQEEYIDALDDYRELYDNQYKDNANINYHIGICYLNIPGQKEKAIDFLLVAVQKASKKYKANSLKEESAPIDAYLFLGNAYRVNNRLNDAIGAYTKYKEIASTAEEVNYANQQIAACNTALKFMGNPVPLKYTNLGDSVNTTSSNFKGVVSGNGKKLLYMNELPFYDAVYFSTYNNGWSSPINITPQIQSDGDQYVSSVSYDGNLLILTREDAFNSDLYQSSFEGGQWTKAVPLSGDDINTKFWESHASLSRDGRTLYFTSNRKDGIGEMDIYVSKLQNDGRWGKPYNIGTVINTPLNEDTPFITENDSILFFSSQGHENMGGYDIFSSRIGINGQWSAPVNLGYPLNTTDDDLFYYPWNNARVGYISKFSRDGFGKDDLYAVQPAHDEELVDLLTAFFTPDETLLPALVPEEKPAITQPVAEKPEMVPVKESEKVVPDLTQGPATLIIDPVYFGFDNFKLTEDGRKQLDKLARILNEYPLVRVKLIGHADSKGAAGYNLKLSEKRALAAISYIKGLGIDPGRLEYTGLGEINFVAINSNPDGSDNPDGRKLNRRVEYELTGLNNALILIKMTPIPEYLKIKK